MPAQPAKKTPVKKTIAKKPVATSAPKTILSGSRFQKKELIMIVAALAVVGVAIVVYTHASGVLCGTLSGASGISNPSSVSGVCVSGTSSVSSPVNYRKYLTLSRFKETVTVHRSAAIGGSVYTSAFTIHNKTATQFAIQDPNNSNGFGYVEATGGLAPNMNMPIRLYISASKPNGIYTGTAAFLYQPTNGAALVATPESLRYTINLVD